MKYELNRLYHTDCVEAMKEMPDNFFELALVDPPYGTGRPGEPAETNGLRSGGIFKKYGKGIEVWDRAPSAEYFKELFRISKNQVIWGGNYFGLPPTRCFIVWRKPTVSETFTMAMAEYAWTSFDANAKVFEFTAIDKNRFHPTQKPVRLYKKILQHFAKPGDKVIDTHAGSGSCLVACHDMGYKWIGFETDRGYYEAALKRIEEYTAQIRMEDYAVRIEQTRLDI